MREVLEEFDDGIDPLYTYPPPHVKLIERSSAEQRSAIKIKLKNLNSCIGLELRKVTHDRDHGKTPSTEAEAVMKRASDEVITLDEGEGLPLVDEEGNDLVSDQEEVLHTHADDIPEHAEDIPESLVRDFNEACLPSASKVPADREVEEPFMVDLDDEASPSVPNNAFLDLDNPFRMVGIKKCSLCVLEVFLDLDNPPQMEVFLKFFTFSCHSGAIDRVLCAHRNTGKISDVGCVNFILTNILLGKWKESFFFIDTEFLPGSKKWLNLRKGLYVLTLQLNEWAREVIRLISTASLSMKCSGGVLFSLCQNLDFFYEDVAKCHL